MHQININNKLALFKDYWNPKIIGELNQQYVKLVKLKGEFIWHKHDNEDELFLVVKGKLKIAFRDKTVSIDENELIIIPKGVEHKPIAEKEVSVLIWVGHISDEAHLWRRGAPRKAITTGLTPSHRHLRRCTMTAVMSPRA